MPTLPLHQHRPLPDWAVNLALLLLLASLWPLDRAMSANMDPYYFSILIQIALNVMLASSLNLINGITGQFSLGHAAFMGIGAYTTGVLLKHFVPADSAPILAGLSLVLLGGVVAAGFGLLVGIPTLRLRGDYLAIATLGFGEIIYTLISRRDQIGPFDVGGASGLHNIPGFTNFFWAGGFAVICVVCMWRLVHSTKGRAFLAVREDQIAAAAMGVNVTYFKVAAFTIGAFFAGVAGGLYGTLLKNLDPESYRFTRSIDFVVMVVLGGSGSITGTILAAVLLTGLSQFLTNFEQYRLLSYSILLIALMLLRPEGLLGRREIWWSRKTPVPPAPQE